MERHLTNFLICTHAVIGIPLVDLAAAQMNAGEVQFCSSTDLAQLSHVYPLDLFL